MTSPESLISKNKNLLNLILKNWENLDESQKSVLTKIWNVLTYKWQLQILLNTPFVIYWLLDKNFESIHSFNQNLLNQLNLPDWLVSFIGFAN
ncbi:hypothetical protein HA143_00410 [Prochlorococcus marinus CUG1415]|nr:hypothetical protein [Prochlorococcus marinus CUG1415]MBW3044786.1 hypothetical protein [Prochlorococcus marinus str. MU1415]